MSTTPTSCELIATAAFGVESSVKWELSRLGYEAKGDQPGRLVFRAGPDAIARSSRKKFEAVARDAHCR